MRSEYLKRIHFNDQHKDMKTLVIIGKVLCLSITTMIIILLSSLKCWSTLNTQVPRELTVRTYNPSLDLNHHCRQAVVIVIRKLMCVCVDVSLTISTKLLAFSNFPSLLIILICVLPHQFERSSCSNLWKGSMFHNGYSTDSNKMRQRHNGEQICPTPCRFRYTLRLLHESVSDPLAVALRK